MKRSRPRVLSALAFLASITLGCGPAYDRQDVFTAPRRATIKVDSRERARVKIRRAPTTQPLPPSNGIDVPIVELD